MTTDTLVDGAIPGRPMRRPVCHRATTTNTRARRSVAPVSSAASAMTERPRPAAEGKVYRTAYIPPSLHLLLAGLFLLALIAGFSLGVGYAVWRG